MKMFVRFMLYSLLLNWAAVALAQTPAPATVPAGYEEEAARAAALLRTAVDLYKEEGDAAFAKFSRQGEFTDGDLYVYVLDRQGHMLAAGGPSAALIGRDVSPLLDDELKQHLAAALQQPDSDTIHSDEYRWKNWQDGKVERKRVYYQLYDDKSFAVGYFVQRSSPDAAQQLLEDAAQAIQADPQGTIARINQLDPEFNRDDLYVFVADLDTQSMVAHGYNRRLLGIHFPDMKNRDGMRVGQKLLDAAEAGETSVSYTWPNPVTGKDEEKQTLIRKVGDYLVAVGYYQESKTAAQ
ncbi:MAG: cache domain-containing protein [Halopseudomonas sp.]|uniref:cache domain-containing protein n=1 Tax=Halopseudomonas sp. TaxID=2901191 RepID=UPI003002046C